MTKLQPGQVGGSLAGHRTRIGAVGLLDFETRQEDLKRSEPDKIYCQIMFDLTIYFQMIFHFALFLIIVSLKASEFVSSVRFLLKEFVK